MIIDIKKKRKIRSTEHNSYYWGVVLNEISSETGHDQQELHEIFKKMYLPKRFVIFAGKEIEAEPTTTNLTPQEFIEYLDKIKLFATQELNIVWQD